MRQGLAKRLVEADFGVWDREERAWGRGAPACIRGGAPSGHPAYPSWKPPVPGQVTHSEGPQGPDTSTLGEG